MRMLSILTAPIISYFQATILLSCSSLTVNDEFSRSDDHVCSEKAKARKKRRNAKYGYRPRKTSFSLMQCLQKQKEMSSPKPLERQRVGVSRENWLEEELILASTPKASSDLLQ